MSLKRNLLFNFILSFSQVAFPLISIPYVSRNLDPSSIGKVGFIDSLTYYFIVVAEFGIVTYGIREISRKRTKNEDLKSTVSELLSLHLFTSCISVLLYLIVVYFLYEKVSNFKLVLFAFSFLLTNGFACEWYFWGTEQFSFITIRSLVTRVLGLISIFILVQQPEDYVWYYGVITGTAIFTVVWNFWALLHQVDVKFGKPKLKKYWRLLRITYQISLVYSIVLMLDNVFLRLLSTSTAVAYYAYSAKIVRMGSSLVTDTLLVFYPRTVSLVQSNDSTTLQKVILNASDFIILTTIPMAVGIFLLADKVTAVYFGDQFLPVVTNLKILSVYPFVKAFSLFINKQLLMPFYKEAVVLNGLWIGAVLFVLVTMPLSFYYGDSGTCAAVVISEVSVLTYYIFRLKDLGTTIRFFRRKVLFHAVTGSALFYPIFSAVNYTIEFPIVNLVVKLFGCFLFYGVFLLLVARNQTAISLVHSVNLALRGNASEKKRV